MCQSNWKMYQLHCLYGRRDFSLVILPTQCCTQCGRSSSGKCGLPHSDNTQNPNLQSIHTRNGKFVYCGYQNSHQHEQDQISCVNKNTHRRLVIYGISAFREGPQCNPAVCDVFIQRVLCVAYKLHHTRWITRSLKCAAM